MSLKVNLQSCRSREGLPPVYYLFKDRATYEDLCQAYNILSIWCCFALTNIDSFLLFGGSGGGRAEERSGDGERQEGNNTSSSHCQQESLCFPFLPFRLVLSVLQDRQINRCFGSLELGCHVSIPSLL